MACGKELTHYLSPILKQADIALLGFPVHKSSITPNLLPPSTKGN